MSTETVAKEIVTLSLEDKLALRESQLKLAGAKEAIHTAIATAQQADRDVIALLKSIAEKLNVNPEEYLFNSDTLAFQPK
jgi:hypothetical protein